MKQFVVFSISIAVLFLTAPLLFAQGTCTPIYGGGQNADGSPFCLEQVSAASNAGAPQGQPTPTQPSGFVTPNDGSTSSPSTKGGMTTQPAPAVKSQPSTGPELFGLAALLPAGALGYFLRRKTS